MSEEHGWTRFGRGGYSEHAGAEIARRNARRARAAENRFAVQLRGVARQIDIIVTGMFGPGLGEDPAAEAIAAEQLRQIEDTLDAYARLITPWARATAARMLAEVAQRDAAGWHRLGQEIGRALVEEIGRAPIGPPLHRLMDEQVALITSLPREAGLRVHHLALEGLTGGRRWEEIAKDILASGEVSRSRANLIARTETGRAATTLTQVRSEHLGSPGYIWRTARDLDVRLRHRELEGQFVVWGQPPIASEPGQRVMRYHAGAGPNCRCFCEPVLAGETPQLGPRPRNPEYLAALRAAGYTSGAAFET